MGIIKMFLSSERRIFVLFWSAVGFALDLFYGSHFFSASFLLQNHEHWPKERKKEISNGANIFSQSFLLDSYCPSLWGYMTYSMLALWFPESVWVFACEGLQYLPTIKMHWLISVFHCAYKYIILHSILQLICHTRSQRCLTCSYYFHMGPDAILYLRPRLIKMSHRISCSDFISINSLLYVFHH